MTDDKSNTSQPGADADLRAQLRALAQDLPDRGFSQALHRRLMAEPAPSPAGAGERAAEWLRQRRAWLWPAGGLAAGVAAYALLFVLHGDPRAVAPLVASAPVPAAPQVVSTGPVLPSFRVPASKVAVIKLAFAAEVAVEDVTFEVKLPEGLAFWSGGKRLPERSFRWPGRLEAGENLVPIAVRGERPGRYPVIASVEVDGRVLEHKVVMEVTAGGT